MLPEKVDAHYHLRLKHHDRQFISKFNKIYDSNFIVHMLYKQLLTCVYMFCVQSCTLSAFIKQIWTNE